MRPGDVYQQGFCTHDEAGRLSYEAADGTAVQCHAVVLATDANGEMAAVPVGTPGVAVNISPAPNGPEGFWSFAMTVPAAYEPGWTVQGFVRYFLPGGWKGVALRPEVLQPGPPQV